MSYDVALHLDFDDQAGMDDYNRVVLGTDYETTHAALPRRRGRYRPAAPAPMRVLEPVQRLIAKMDAAGVDMTC